MEEYEGKCPKCGKTHMLRGRVETVVCDCWKCCPICGAEMMPYNPDTSPKTYALNSLRELQILMVCTRARRGSLLAEQSLKKEPLGNLELTAPLRGYSATSSKAAMWLKAKGDTARPT